MRRPSHLVAAASATVLLLAGCADEDPGIEIGSEGTEEEVPEEVEEPEAPDEEATDAGSGDAGSEGAGDEDVEEPTDGAEDAAEEPAPEETDDAGEASSPTPDPDLLADPCTPHEGREGDAFLEVVSPVAGQDVGDGGEVQLTGCGNVFEANVVWELVTADGTVLDDGFTTATCGSGCVGAFDEVLDLSAGAGEDGVELHVSSPDVSEGEGDGDELRQTVALTYS